ncbi:MAG: LON peptidase substrate-binding domain-containing protein [Lachnospiraceae bacterium]|nr:LON peptidase substrate-binding domain-containing protein [Lachnospiraceae bacterium]
MSYNLNLFPAVVLRGMTIFPGTVAHFDISNTRDIHAVEQAMVGQEQVFLVTQKNLEADRPEIGDLYEVGVVARVRQVIKMNPGIVRVLVEGLYRGRLAMMEMSGE